MSRLVLHPLCSRLRGWCRPGSLGRLLGPAPTPMPTERARRRELSQLMTHHVLRHKQLQKALPVVDQKRLTHKLRHDRARPSPRPDRLPPPPPPPPPRPHLL